jgi:hypothetical protein
LISFVEFSFDKAKAKNTAKQRHSGEAWEEEEETVKPCSQPARQIASQITVRSTEGK